MPTSSPHLTSDELARLGSDAFDRFVRPVLRPEDDGKYAAIDATSGDFELDADDFYAVARLRARCPAAEVWLERVGQPTAYQLRRTR